MGSYTCTVLAGVAGVVTASSRTNRKGSLEAVGLTGSSTTMPATGMFEALRNDRL